jgi:serine/threonine protein kinase
MRELAVGTVFAGHRIDGVAGRGGMGVVYRARQVRLDRLVALKVIAPELAELPGFGERFEQESRIAASIDHPNVVDVHEAGEADGHLYLVMRYVEGSTSRR